MNKHQWVKLLAATAVVIGLAYWVNTSREPQVSSESSGAPLVVGLKAAVNDVKRLQVIGAGNQTLVTLDKSQGGWTVAERDGYPADIEKVRAYLLRLADSTLIEAKTSSPKLYSKLGVESVDAADAKGMRVDIEGMKAPVKIIVGNFNGQGVGATFVRRNDEVQSWLAKGTLTPEKLATNWVDKALIDIPSSRIEKIEIDNGGKLLVARKATPVEANFQIDNVPKGRELKSDFEGNGLAGVLSGMRFEEVKKAATDELTEANASIKMRYQTFDGVIIKAMSRVDGDKTWVAFSAALDPAVAEASILREQEQAKIDFENASKAHAQAAADKSAKDEKAVAEMPSAPSEPLSMTDPAKDKAEHMQKLEKEVSVLNARFSGWLYNLPPFTYSGMSRKIEELLKSETPEG